jgi:hypothetical protein
MSDLSAPLPPLKIEGVRPSEPPAPSTTPSPNIQETQAPVETPAPAGLPTTETSTATQGPSAPPADSPVEKTDIFTDPPKVPHSANETLNPTQVINRHIVKIIDKSNDASQVYPMLIKCTCGFEGRTGSQLATPEQNHSFAEAMASNHVGVRGIIERPEYVKKGV